MPRIDPPVALRSSREKILTFWITLSKWITFKTSDTSTNSSMYSNSAFCIKSTSTRTWIKAFLINTSLCCWTFRVQDTFWFTCQVRIPNIIIHTFTNSSSIQNCTKCISSTRWRVTRIIFRRWNWIDITSYKWISCVSSWTTTNRIVDFNCTLSIDSTSAWTWILTLSIDTG